MFLSAGRLANASSILTSAKRGRDSLGSWVLGCSLRNETRNDLACRAVHGAEVFCRSATPVSIMVSEVRKS